MSNPSSTAPPASERSLAAQANALAKLLEREFAVPFQVFEAETGACLNGTAGQPPMAGSFPPPHQDLENDVGVSIASDGAFHLCLRRKQAGGTLIARARMTYGQPAMPIADAVLSLQQRVLLRWLNAVRDRLRLEDQLRKKERLERSPVVQNATTWDALMTLNNLARKLRAHKSPKGNHEQILKAAFGFARAQALYWIPLRPESAVLVEGERILSDAEARQLGHALGKCPELKAPAPLFFNRVSMTRWGWRFASLKSLVAFLVTDQGPLGWLVAMNRQQGQLFRRSDAALLLPFVAMLELHLRWSQRNKDLKGLLLGLTQSLATALDAKDAYTFGHSERVARVSVELGKELGMRGEELGRLYLAGLLHDVGKIGVKDTILQKRGALTSEEQEHVRQHVMIGYWILAELKPIRHLLPAVLHHHERYDGGGYPAGLARDKIPLLARILAVADAYDAMSHQRSYRESLPYHRVEATLVAGAGTQWDSDVVDAFPRCRQRIRAINRRPIGNGLRKAIETTLALDNSVPLHGPHPKRTRTASGQSISKQTETTSGL